MAGSLTMRRYATRAPAAIIALALVLAGCGSTQAHHARRTRYAKVLSLAERAVSAAAFPGFSTVLPPQVIHGPTQWGADAGQVDQSLKAEVRRLERWRFIAGARERMNSQAGPSPAAVKSQVEEFDSASGARAQLAFLRSQLLGARGLAISRFRVPAVPGAVGVTSVGPFATTRTVAFAAGRFCYQVVLVAPHGGSAPTQAELVAAAGSWYRRVHNAVPQ